jgi:hypothetical protein
MACLFLKVDEAGPTLLDWTCRSKNWHGKLAAAGALLEGLRLFVTGSDAAEVWNHSRRQFRVFRLCNVSLHLPERLRLVLGADGDIDSVRLQRLGPTQDLDVPRCKETRKQAALGLWTLVWFVDQAGCTDMRLARTARGVVPSLPARAPIWSAPCSSSQLEVQPQQRYGMDEDFGAELVDLVDL